MAKHRLISNFFSKTFPLLKRESTFPELSDWEHHKASTGPGGHSRHLHCTCVYEEHTQPSRPSRRQERSRHQLSCQSLRESAPQPHMPVVMGKVPQTHTQTGRAAGRQLTRAGGLFSHSLMNQAEEICFRSIISASNLSWPG